MTASREHSLGGGVWEACGDNACCCVYVLDGRRYKRKHRHVRTFVPAPCSCDRFYSNRPKFHRAVCDYRRSFAPPRAEEKE